MTKKRQQDQTDNQEQEQVNEQTQKEAEEQEQINDQDLEEAEDKGEDEDVDQAKPKSKRRKKDNFVDLNKAKASALFMAFILLAIAVFAVIFALFGFLLARLVP